MNKRQAIFVNNHAFEFSQYDQIFTLAKPKVSEVAKNLQEGKKIKVVAF
jgi:hypothetical protein